MKGVGNVLRVYTCDDSSLCFLPTHSRTVYTATFQPALKQWSGRWIRIYFHPKVFHFGHIDVCCVRSWRVEYRATQTLHCPFELDVYAYVTQATTSTPLPSPSSTNFIPVQFSQVEFRGLNAVWERWSSCVWLVQSSVALMFVYVIFTLHVYVWLRFWELRTKVYTIHELYALNNKNGSRSKRKVRNAFVRQMFCNTRRNIVAGFGWDLFDFECVN